MLSFYSTIPHLGIVAEVNMNLCIDVGNTTIGMGFFKEEKLIKTLSFTVDDRKTKDEYISLLKQSLKENNLIDSKIDHIIFSSVVPSINESLIEALKELFEVEPLLIGPGIKTGLKIRVDNPNEVGNDLIAVMVGAKEKYGFPCLIADLGTASKVLLIDKEGAFISCMIMPGLSLSVTSLTNRAALLPEIAIRRPKNVLSKNTIDAINNGVVYGHADMITGIVNRYEKEIGYKCKHILSGGGAIYVKDILDDSYVFDATLCLEGLNHIIKKNVEE